MRGVPEYYNYFLDFESQEKRLQKIPQVQNPKTDNEFALYYQREYLEHENQKAYVKLWELFTKLCERAIRKELKKNKVRIGEDELLYKADIACEYVMRRYIKQKRMKGEFYYMTNAIAEAHNAMLHALYSDNENDFFLERAKSLEFIRESKLKKENLENEGIY